MSNSPRFFPGERRNVLIVGDYDLTITFSVECFIAYAKQAIADHGAFYVALSGGSTPKAIFERLTKEPYAKYVDWPNVYLFWSDERPVLPDDPRSNYRMAMEAGFDKMPIPKTQIHRMVAEEKIVTHAELYEKTIKEVVKTGSFDLVMLGMGEDGHTASLFPYTESLKETDPLVTYGYFPAQQSWRMTLTYRCINEAQNAVFHILGAAKKHIVAEVFLSEDQFDRFPAQGVGTKERPARWVLDEAAGSELQELIPKKP